MRGRHITQACIGERKGNWREAGIKIAMGSKGTGFQTQLRSGAVRSTWHTLDDDATYICKYSKYNKASVSGCSPDLNSGCCRPLLLEGWSVEED